MRMFEAECVRDRHRIGEVTSDGSHIGQHSILLFDAKER